jgi:hypothetical protein
VGVLRAALVACVAALPVAACGFDGGGLGAGSDDGGGDDASLDATGGGDAAHRVDAATDHAAQDGAVDGRADARPEAGCDANAAEVCNNGIDDNCDGKVDCADPMCSGTGWTCVTAPPQPWTYVGFFGAVASCPAPFATTTPMKTGPMSTQESCSCTCNVGNPPTTCDLFGINDCQGTLYVAWPANGGMCTQSNFGFGTADIAVYGYASNGTCNAAPSGFYGSTATDVTVCGGAATGAGCAANQVCAPPLPSGEDCVMQGGEVAACPTGFTAKQVTVGTAIADGRMCGCTPCDSGAMEDCPNASLKLWLGNDCMGGADWSGNENVCTMNNGPFDQYEFVGGSPDGTPTCQFANTTAMTTGTLSLASPSTVCCAN